jgi:serine phosphatase RsbU (regulator of sigma subunit)
MPLGLMPGMSYEEKEATLEAGDSILFYSDGLVEAHNPQREMFGFPRLQALVAEHAEGKPLVEFLMEELRSFTGHGWEQEDDITLVALQRSAQ